MSQGGTFLQYFTWTPTPLNLFSCKYESKSWNIVWKAQLDDKSKGEYDDEKHVQFAHISLVHLLIINKDDKSMLN